MKDIFERYLQRLDILDERLDDDFSDLAFAYDYNEVQELFFNAGQNDFVILAGASGLRKKDMLSRICRDLYASGVEKESILYLDYELPILHGENVLKIIDNFAKRDKVCYVVINELQEAQNWRSLPVKLRNLYPNLKLIASSSVPHLVYETLYDEPCDFCKVVVLSQKNGSNVKYRSEGFGVFGEFKYNVKDGYVEIKGLTKRGKGLPRHDVPSTIDGLPVKVIASGAFHDRVELTQITIPEGVEMIGDYAFSKCCSLAEITLPSTLKYVGDHAFLGATKLAKIEGGANVEHVGNSALYATAWLAAQTEFAVIGKTLYRYLGKNREVSVPKGIAHAAAFCFADTDVERVAAAENIQLSEGMFYRCKSLKRLELNFTHVPPFAFYGCESLQLGGKFDSIGRFAFYGCKNVTAVEASQIGACALAFSTVKEVVGARELLSGALFECGNLRKLELASNARVGSFAVCNTQLDSLSLVGCAVGDYAFCDNLQLSCVDASSVASVGRGVLYGCGVTKMRVCGNAPLSRWFAPQASPVKHLCVEGDVVDNFCRNNATIEQLELRNVNNFGRWSFYGNTSLAKITLHNVTRVGDWAFAYCNGLRSVVLPQEVRYVGMNAFRYCRNLNEITLLADTVVPFGPNAFYSTGENKQLTLPKNAAEAYASSELWREYVRTSKIVEI